MSPDTGYRYVGHACPLIHSPIILDMRRPLTQGTIILNNTYPLTYGTIMLNMTYRVRYGTILLNSTYPLTYTQFVHTSVRIPNCIIAVETKTVALY